MKTNRLLACFDVSAFIGSFIKVSIIVLCCLFHNRCLSQNLSAIDFARAKNYPLLTLFQNNIQVTNLLKSDTLLVGFLSRRKVDSERVIVEDKADEMLKYFKFSDLDIKIISNELKVILNSLPRVEYIANQLRRSGFYSEFNNRSSIELIIAAWQNEARGINHVISVYAQGIKPNYPTIDSISFNVIKPDEKRIITETASKLLTVNKNENLFFVPSMNAALAFLELNGRSDAGNYEPMEKTVNRLAVNKIKIIDWKKFPYTVILVPGIGPEDGVSLDPSGKQHCDLAIEQYKKGLAPFIMVSGGKVHPYKTKYCEAEEMKKYIISLGIPESAVIMEPHARHTTTNLRNASRLIYKYNIPADKPAVVITDPEQSAAISRMERRCLQELGYVPYKLGSRLSDKMQEFYAVQEANQINYTEPLDP